MQGVFFGAKPSISSGKNLSFKSPESLQYQPNFIEEEMWLVFDTSSKEDDIRVGIAGADGTDLSLPQARVQTAPSTGSDGNKNVFASPRPHSTFAAPSGASSFASPHHRFLVRATGRCFFGT
jgi:hypothetical protein